MQFPRTVIYSLAVVPLLAGCVNPKPFHAEDIAESAFTDVEQIYASQEPLEGVLTLSEAMARALKYNLDNRVKLMEQAVARQSVEMAKLDMLPMVGVSAGYLDRTNTDASESVSIFTGRQSLEPSTSQDRRRFTADIRFTWNILDFGVSYFQAKQNSDRFLISQKGREKVMLKLLQQVRSAYWRAVIMQRLEKDVNSILENVNTTLEDLKAVREQQLYTPLFALNDIRLLVEMKKQLEELKESISIANVELTKLINVPSRVHLKLEKPEEFKHMYSVPDDLSDEEMEKLIDAVELTALINSADYANEMYNVRIDRLESRKTLARLLPGIEFSYSGNFSSNSFLWNNLWGELGLRLAGDLLKLLTIPDILDYAEVSEKLAHSRRLAVNTAVLTSLHLAWQEFLNSVDRLKQSSFLNEVDREIAELTRNAEKNRSGSEVEAIQSEFKAFNSQLSNLLDYAQVQDSFGAFLLSLGSNPVPEHYQSLSVKELSAVLEKKYELWEHGKLELLTEDYMKERIALRKKKEEEQAWWKDILGNSVDMPPLKYSVFNLLEAEEAEEEDKSKKKKSEPENVKKSVKKEAQPENEQKESIKAADKKKQRSETVKNDGKSKERLESVKAADKKEERSESVKKSGKSEERPESVKAADKKEERSESVKKDGKSEERPESVKADKEESLDA